MMMSDNDDTPSDFLDSCHSIPCYYLVEASEEVLQIRAKGILAEARFREVRHNKRSGKVN